MFLFHTRIPNDPNFLFLSLKSHKTTPDLSPSLLPIPNCHGISLVGSNEPTIVTLKAYHPLTLSDPKDLKPHIHTLATPSPWAIRQIAWRHFFQVQDHIYSEDWAIGIQVLTSFRMLLDNGKTVYRHCNLCYIRKTVSWCTRVKFQVGYIQWAVRIHSEPYSFQVIKPMRSCILSFLGLLPLFSVLMPTIHGFFFLTLSEEGRWATYKTRCGRCSSSTSHVMQSHGWTDFDLKASLGDKQNRHLPSEEWENGDTEPSWLQKSNQLFKGTAGTKSWLFDPCSCQQALWAAVTSVAQPLETRKVHSQHRKSWRGGCDPAFCASRQG